MEACLSVGSDKMCLVKWHVLDSSESSSAVWKKTVKETAWHFGKLAYLEETFEYLELHASMADYFSLAKRLQPVLRLKKIVIINLFVQKVMCLAVATYQSDMKMASIFSVNSLQETNLSTFPKTLNQRRVGEKWTLTTLFDFKWSLWT